MTAKQSLIRAGTYLALVAVIAGISFLYTYRYIKGMHSPHDPVFGLIAMLNGTAAKPFIYRDLLGMTTRALDKALPYFATLDPFGLALAKYQSLGGNELRLCTIAAWQTFLAYSLYGTALLCIASKALKLNLGAQFELVFVGMMVPIFWTYDRTFFVESYDAITLCIAGWLTAFWLGRKHLAFGGLLIFGIFAKESLVVFSFLPLASFAAERKLREFGVGVVSLGMVYVAIHVLLHALYRNNPGPDLEVAENHGSLTSAVENLYVVRNLKLLVPTNADSLRFYVRLSILAIPLVVAIKRLEAPPRAAVVATSAAFLLSVALLGRFIEMRVFFELVPIWIAVIFGVFSKPGQLNMGRKVVRP